MIVHIRTRTGPVMVGLAVLALLATPACGRPAADDPPAVAGADQPAVAGTDQPAVAGTGPATEAPTGSAPSELPDPCGLVSKAEAEKLAGTPLDDAVPVRDTCTYTGPVTGPTAQVEIFVGDGAKKFLDIERELGHEIWPLPGVGDEAYAEDGAVFVNRAGRWVSIRLVLLSDPKESRAPLEELARTVATRF